MGDEEEIRRVHGGVGNPMAHDGFAQKVYGGEIQAARGAADSIKPGVKRSGTPGSSVQGKPLEPAERPLEVRILETSIRAFVCRPLRGLGLFVTRHPSWGYASLQPRLYAVGRSRGLGLFL